MRAFLTYLAIALLGCVALSAFMVTYSGNPYPSTVGPVFDDAVDLTHRQGLEAQKPDVVVLGDSLVEENVDAPALSAILGKQVYPIAYPGSSSAVWYLATKNLIGAASYHPPTVVILFRDDMLTAPAYRVNGRYFVPVETLASSSDTLAAQLAYVNQMNPIERWAEAYFPIYNLRLKVREQIDHSLRYTLTQDLLKCGKRCTDTAMDTELRTANMEMNMLSEAIFTAESYLYSPALLDFNRQLPRSFLPEIIRLARENGIHLIFVRAKTLIFPTKASEPPGLAAYLTDLQKYLRENGAGYADLNAGRIPAEFFLDGVHMRPEGKIVYTRALGDALLSLIP
jgi:lysophospholipase L1-like esterase